MHIFGIFLCIILSGMAGGIGGALMGDDFLPKDANRNGTILDQVRSVEKDWWAMVKSVTLGLIAAFVVPLFLVLAGAGHSNLLLNLTSCSEKCNEWWSNLLILIGFCLVAALIAQRFLNTIADKLIEQAKKDASAARQDAQEAKARSEEALEAAQLLGPNQELDETSKKVLSGFLQIPDLPASTEQIAEQVQLNVDEVSETLHDLKEAGLIVAHQTGAWKLREWGRIRVLADVGLDEKELSVLKSFDALLERRPSPEALANHASLPPMDTERVLRRLERFGLIARSSRVNDGWRLKSRGKVVLTEMNNKA